MKEKDLEQNLDNLIIDGLIKEAEQDNADFEAAMRQMSDEEFEELIYEPANSYEPKIHASRMPSSPIAMNHECSYNMMMEDSYDMTESENQRAQHEYRRVPQPPVAQKSKWQVFRPWITSAVAAAAVVIIVLIPSVNAMNGKLCDSALSASSEYIASSRSASEINGLSDNQLKAKLPELEKRYKDCIKEGAKFTSYTDDLQDAGWDLALAYLRLHKKGDAVKVLKVLSAQYKGSPFGDQCQKMLDQL